MAITIIITFDKDESAIPGMKYSFSNWEIRLAVYQYLHVWWPPFRTPYGTPHISWIPDPSQGEALPPHAVWINPMGVLWSCSRSDRLSAKYQQVEENLAWEVEILFPKWGSQQDWWSDEIRSWSDDYGNVLNNGTKNWEQFTNGIVWLATWWVDTASSSLVKTCKKDPSWSILVGPTTILYYTNYAKNMMGII